MPHLADAPEQLPGGNMRRILRIDVTTETGTVEPLSPDDARMWLGGTGLGQRPNPRLASRPWMWTGFWRALTDAPQNRVNPS